MYNIDDHIEAARKKEEWWSVAQMESIRDKVNKQFPFGNDETTLLVLDHMLVEQRALRDNFVKFSVDFGTEWSKLVIIENIRMMVKNAIGDEYEEHY